MHSVLLGLGSNKGDKKRFIDSAIQKLNTQLGKVVVCADLFTTAAWGKEDQDAFLNTAIIVKTIYSPLMCFKIIKEIEQQLGRKSTEHWGPREIDIDILLFNHLVLESKILTIPHAEMHHRNFVMIPSAQIASKWVHPKLKQTIGSLAHACTDPLSVELWKS